MVNGEHVRKIEEALVAVHHHRQDGAIDHRWSQRVLAAVHAEPRLQGYSWVDTAIQGIVWRCGALAGFGALVVLACLVISSGGPEQFVAGLILEDLAGASLVPFIAL